MILNCPCCQHRTYVDDSLAEHLTRCDRCQNFVQVQSIFGASDGLKRFRLVPIVPTMVLAQTNHPVTMGYRASKSVIPTPRPSSSLPKPQEARLRCGQLYTLVALGIALVFLLLAAATLMLKVGQLNGGPRHAAAAHIAPENEAAISQKP